ncbi:MULTISPECIES: glycosyltransferase family 4 protein [unclassified Thiocapsa]|uniref:glycosyltransferase family 4 protein n=1 Tax=unclassified Thiocapsa TaxID=2641286 RepID=UPI0035B284DD
MSVDLQRLRLPRLAWNSLALLRGERYGGFQYTRLGNETMARQIDWDAVGEVISHAQHFPPWELMVKNGIGFSHYIDFPLPDLFDDYEIAKTIGARTARNALARERDQYAAARYVVCMSPWAVKQVIERCGTPGEKVHAIIPGANLPEELFSTVVPSPETEPPDGRTIPLKIAFVGKIPLRKGLDRLVEGLRILRGRGLRSQVRVIGPSQNLFPNDPEVEHLGFINKQQEPNRLVAELRDCHLGALPSYQEAFGIAALEYLRCGLPALITRTGGLADSLPTDCRVLLEQDCTGGDIADALEHLLRNPDVFADLQRNARAKADYASWNRCVREFQALWGLTPAALQKEVAG